MTAHPLESSVPPLAVASRLWRFAPAAAKWRDGEGAPARRGHPAAAEEPAEEGRVCAAVHQRRRRRHLQHHAVRDADPQGQQAAGNVEIRLKTQGDEFSLL